jgi:hypothetical protein
MPFAESVGRCSISINLIDSELAEALPGRRTVSVCTALKRCQADASPTSKVNVNWQRAEEATRPLRLRSAYAERRGKLDLAMIKGDRTLCAVAWEEVNLGKLVSELR